jgi:hypothetical protein
MKFNYSHLIKEISRYLLESAIETKASYDVTDTRDLLLSDSSYYG